MNTWKNVYEKLAAFNIAETAGDALIETKDEITDLQKRQLLEGKGSDGNDLSPGYLEDPYFKTIEAAKRYMEWKKQISPPSDRNPNAPNLYINGQFHSTINTSASRTFFDVESNSKIAYDINAKYKGKALGLSPKSKKEYAFGPFWSVLKAETEKLTGLKFS